MRTLLVLMVVGALFCGWRVNRAAENRERVAAVEKAVDEIKKLALSVESKYENQRSATWLEELFDDPGGSDDPVSVLHVSGVDLWDTDVTDDGLACGSTREFDTMDSFALSTTVSGV